MFTFMRFHFVTQSVSHVTGITSRIKRLTEDYMEHMIRVLNYLLFIQFFFRVKCRLHNLFFVDHIASDYDI